MLSKKCSIPEEKYADDNRLGNTNAQPLIVFSPICGNYISF